MKNTLTQNGIEKRQLKIFNFQFSIPFFLLLAFAPVLPCSAPIVVPPYDGNSNNVLHGNWTLSPKGYTTDGTDAAFPGVLSANSGVFSNTVITAGEIPLYPIIQPTRLIFVGDSLSGGAVSYRWSYWFTNRWMNRFITDTVNLSVAGMSLAEMVTNYVDAVQPWKPASGTNALLFLWGGINQGIDAEETFGQWTNYLNTAHADGFSVIAFTITDASTLNASSRTNRQVLNNWIRTSPLWDYLVDVDDILPTANQATVEGLHFDTNHFRILADHVFKVLVDGKHLSKVQPAYPQGPPAVVQYDGTLEWQYQFENVPLASTAVSNLVAAPIGFPIVYCSDVITSLGTGGYVRWNGSAWKTWEDVTATPNLTNFIFNCVSAGFNRVTPRSSIYQVSDIAPPQTGVAPIVANFPRTYVSSGSGASYTVQQVINTTYGPLFALATGTTTTGSQVAWGVFHPAIAASDIYSCGGRYSFNALSEGVETYWSVIGMMSATSAAFPVTGAFFLYDASNVNGHGLNTNNWICVTGQASSYTFTDSALAATTGTSSTIKLKVLATTVGVAFYTNEVLCAYHTSNIPTTTLYLSKAQMVKTAGTTATSLYEAAPFTHLRRAGDRTY